MSSQQRDPLWYCHQCNTEMRPLMTPEPQCENCHGTFVEKIEDPEDDPRDFHQAGFNPTNDPLRLFASLLGQQEHRHRSPTNSDQDTPRRSFSPLMPGSFQMEFGTSNGRTFIVGGPNTLFPRRRSFDRENETPGANPPTLHDFLRIAREETESDNDRRPSIPGNLMAQYLFALLAGAPAGVTSGANSPGSGRWGDYIFSQDALDRLITQIMENSNVNRPVPAPEDVVENLPRKVLELGDPLLENDCAVCKEQFDAKAAEPSEQIVITLPCKHAFHEGCILPWLKSSGTCPVCRFALVPQPNSHSHEAGPSASSSSPPPSGGTHPTRRRSSNEYNGGQFLF
ncbi:zinc finger 364 [Pyrrhoderma noxium]|uniref:Zinc finger 364 n=1 Tax=Pyrrhoderma noxium TaxID=2282107 RepID=A0A286UR44_9AGAM|nr:zinc finger 364 [Pyrrhoderma noxium]